MGPEAALQRHKPQPRKNLWFIWNQGNFARTPSREAYDGYLRNPLRRVRERIPPIGKKRLPNSRPSSRPWAMGSLHRSIRLRMPRLRRQRRSNRRQPISRKNGERKGLSSLLGSLLQSAIHLFKATFRISVEAFRHEWYQQACELLVLNEADTFFV